MPSAPAVFEVRTNPAANLFLAEQRACSDALMSVENRAVTQDLDRVSHTFVLNGDSQLLQLGSRQIAEDVILPCVSLQRVDFTSLDDFVLGLFVG